MEGVNQAIFSRDQIGDYVSYDPLTGEIRWKYRKEGPKNWNSRLAGKVVDNKSSGYIRFPVKGVWVRGHDVAWFLTYGEWPTLNLDHINRDPADNRIENLRLATQSQNCVNRNLRSDNTSGFTGVSWNKNCKKWSASVMRDGKRFHIGLFEDKKEAALSYNYKIYGLFGPRCNFNQVF